MSKTATIEREYELTYLVPTGYTDTELNQIKKEIETLAKKHGGSVVKQEDWGKKPLAYRLKKAGKLIEEANYFYFELSFDPAKAKSFERDVYLNNKLIRHLFVLAEPEEVANAKPMTSTPDMSESLAE
jgi:small subunit ribosomal protein S6